MSETILEEAQRLTSGDRHQDYGTYTEEAKKVAAGWAVIFGCEIPARKVGLAMAWLKIVRECKKPKRDNRTDGAAYFHLTDQVVTDEETKRCDRCEIGTSVLPDGGCTNCVYQTDPDDFPPHGERVQVADLEDEADTVLSDDKCQHNWCLTGNGYSSPTERKSVVQCTECGESKYINDAVASKYKKMLPESVPLPKWAQWKSKQELQESQRLEDLAFGGHPIATCPFCHEPSHPNGTPCPKRLEEQLQMRKQPIDMSALAAQQIG